MAILQGFPPSNTISPSVRITEKDLSYIPTSLTFNSAGLVGFASKGPINLPTVVSSQRQLVSTFGYPHPEQGDPYMIYAAQQYLQVGTQLYIVRVAETDAVSNEAAATAYADVPASGSLIYDYSKLNTFYFNVDTFLTWSLNGIPASKILVIPAGAYDLVGTDNPYDTIFPPTVRNDGSGVYTNLCCQLNSQLDYSDPAHPGYLDGIWFQKNSTTISLVNNNDLLVEVISHPDANPLDVSSETGVTAGGLMVKTLWASGPTCSLEWRSVNHSALHPLVDVVTEGGHVDTGMGLGIGMQSAFVTGAATCYNPQYACSSNDIVGTFIIPANATQLQVVVDGTQNDNVDNVVQTIDLSGLADGNPHTTLEVVNEINNQITLGYTYGDQTALIPGGFCAVGGGATTGPEIATGVTIDLDTVIFPELGDEDTTAFDGDAFTSHQITLVTLHTGREAAIYVRPSSTANAIFGFDAYDANQNSINAETAYGYSPPGTSGSGGEDAYGILYGASGTNCGNGTSSGCCFTLTADSAGIEGNNTSVGINVNTQEGPFSLSVYNNGSQVESWGNLTKDSTSSFYVETFLSLVSDYVRCIDNTNVLALPVDTGTSPLYLSGGSDGIPSDPDEQDKLLVGNPIGYTGMYALSDPEQIDLDLLACPGHASTDVVYELLNICQNVRMDCLAIIDPPFGLTVQEIVQWQNGLHPLNTTRFDSDFGALYWPWVKQYDSYNGLNMWVPPSGSVMATIAQSDNLSEPWFAPAGVNRGVVPGITDVFSRPTLTERDLMYGNQNCINPIVQFAEYGTFMIWGQKTMQRMPTALNRVNVRRLMFYLEKEIRQGSKAMLFEPHDEQFHLQWANMAKGILDNVKSGRGISAYIIDAGWDLNTPEVVASNEFRAVIGIMPVYAVEYIFIEFSINSPLGWSDTTLQPYSSGAVIT